MYFHDGEAVRIDNDNLVKPILDALNGVVYRDDSLIVETHVSKKPIDGAYRVRHISPVLAHAFHIGSEFLYIQIEEFVEAGELLP
jgi:crossover junction endodeoxyribonuclease RusA